MPDENSSQKKLNNETRETEIFPVVTPAPLLWQFLLGISLNLYLLALCNPVTDYPPWPSELWRMLSDLTLPQQLRWFLQRWWWWWWANPLLPASWIAGCYGRRRFAVTFGGLSFLLGILLHRSLPADMHNEGYYFWMGSIAFAILAGISLPRVPS